MTKIKLGSYVTPIQQPKVQAQTITTVQIKTACAEALPFRDVIEQLRSLMDKYRNQVATLANAKSIAYNNLLKAGWPAVFFNQKGQVMSRPDILNIVNQAMSNARKCATHPNPEKRTEIVARAREISQAFTQIQTPNPEFHAAEAAYRTAHAAFEEPEKNLTLMANTIAELEAQIHGVADTQWLDEIERQFSASSKPEIAAPTVTPQVDKLVKVKEYLAKKGLSPENVSRAIADHNLTTVAQAKTLAGKDILAYL